MRSALQLSGSVSPEAGRLGVCLAWLTALACAESEWAAMLGQGWVANGS